MIGLLKKLFVGLLLVTCYLLLVTSAYAEGEFSTSIVAQYTVNPNGKTLVSHTVTLTNRFSTIHALSYSFILQGSAPTEIHAFENNIQLPLSTETAGDQTKITVTFSQPVVGKGKERSFTIEYQDVRVATKNGQVWEITIPKVEDIDKYDNYELSLLVPNTFGQPAYISPQPMDTTVHGEFIVHYFSKERLLESGVVAGYGSFQVFEFELAYHLRNPHRTLGETEVALPPDSAFQRVFYTSINPSPRSIRIDEDGNWLALYRLKSNETLDITARGAVQLFATPQEFYPKQTPNLNRYLAPNTYWQTQDPQIAALAQELKTPYEIYNYVVRTLSYDYSRVRENVERLGATGVLANPQNAICMEFTDLFIALARAAGIPAREVNGYAYTENPQIQPLSLVADVLHAWPEYWDQEREVWVPVDPTWGNTTGGVDFFSKLDLAHFAFVIHGEDAEQPYPAGSYKLAENPQKDVVVFFGSLPTQKTQANLALSLSKQLIPFRPLRGVLSVGNNGPTALYNLTPQISATTGIILEPPPTIAYLLPFTTQPLSFSWKSEGFFPQKGYISAFVENGSARYTIGTEFLVLRIVTLFLILLLVSVGALAPVLLRGRAKKYVERIKSSHIFGRIPFQKR